MADLTLLLTFPQASVVTGENFAASISITNTGTSARTAPADFGDDDYRFVLTPMGGGEPIVLSRRALESARQPGALQERLLPPAAPLTIELAPGAARVAETYPARLSQRAIPAGVYGVTVSLLSNPAVVSPPARLDVEAPFIVASHITGGGMELGAELTWLHRDGSGAHHLFGGVGDVLAPARVAGLRILKMTGPVKDLQFAHAVDTEGGGGPLMAAWLSPDGTFAAAVAQSAYVVAKTGPVPLGLTEARLAPTGWKTGSMTYAASFAVLGKQDGKVVLALISLDRDGKWVPQVQRHALTLPGMPVGWRVSRQPDGGHVLLVGYAQDAGSRVLKLQIGANGAAQGSPVELMRSTQPLVTLSAPLLATPASVFQALTGPGPVASRPDALTMTFHVLPIDGAAPRVQSFIVPTANGAPPVDWSMAEGAPTQAAIVARNATDILGVRFKDAVQGVRLSDARPAAAGLTAIVIGRRAWALWREGTASIEGQPFPP